MRRVKEDFGKKDIFIDQDREIDSFFFLHRNGITN